MKKNELTIEIPNDKIVDWEESKKQNKIVLKNKKLSYEDVCNKLFKNKEIFFVGSADGTIKSVSYMGVSGYLSDENNATTKHQLECILAKNKLANVAIYLNDGWKPTYTGVGQYDAWVIYTTPQKDHVGIVKIDDCCCNSNVLFKTRELAQQAIEILGEENVELALEPLGFNVN